ncbi:N-acetylmuramoyl-L-alanine amidase [Flavihumibacter sp. UBA7668]|uniref:N-acetylmuramoyl-L-alanine amidase n=1 Tax=Flavihumibacter sp. UBA7668 TaxID=1946542 RepID=UPI0025BC3062|nr:N-acetylmuramoyl-L-alanine amidase [Flavihumibacter sp. UBA7668]
MSFLLITITKMLICSGILLAYYWLFLRDHRFHQYNRYYLLSVLVLSLVLPFLQIILPIPGGGAIDRTVIRTMEVITVYGEGEEAGFLAGNRSFNWSQLLWLVYLIGISAGTVTLVKAIRSIERMRKQYEGEQLDDIQIYHTKEQGTPFSFFRSIFWNDQIELHSRAGQQIFRHELFHIRQYHSLDSLFTNLAIILCWFNPFYYLIRNELRTIHEYLADQHAAGTGEQLEYAEVLLERSIRARQFTLSHHFFQHQLKRRIHMLTNIQFKKTSYWSRLMALPLVIGTSLFLLAFVARKSGNQLMAKKRITIVVDAGHGGKDPGVKSADGITEQLLALQLAKKTAALAEAYNVEVVLTRTGEELPNGLTDPNEAARWRAELARKIKPTLFISLHIDGVVPKNNGFNIYVPREISPNPDKKESRDAAQIFQHQLGVVVNVNEIRERKNSGIWVLDQVNCPSILIECGSILHQEDLNFIRQEANQEKIARKLLESAVLFAEHQKKNGMVVLETMDNQFLQQDTGWRTALARHFQSNLKVPSTAVAGSGSDKVAATVKLKSDGSFESISFHGDETALQSGYISLVVVGYQPGGGRLNNHSLKTEVKRVAAGYKARTGAPDQYDILVHFVDGPKTGSPGEHNRKEIEKTFTQAEVMPAFPGGKEAWQKFLNTTLHYPQEAIDKETSGTAIIGFIVKADSSISDIQIIKDPGNGLGEEARRVIEASGKWSPAIQNGKTVHCYFKQPVTFLLERE